VIIVAPLLEGTVPALGSQLLYAKGEEEASVEPDPRSRLDE